LRQGSAFFPNIIVIYLTALLGYGRFLNWTLF